MSFRNADVLYAAGDAILEKYGVRIWRTLPAEEGRRSFSRSGDAWLFDRNMERYRKAESGVARAAHHVHATDDNWYRGHLLERGVTPVSDDSVLFDSTSAWTRSGISFEASRTSIFDTLPTNGEARTFTSTSSARLRLTQAVGTLTGSKEAFMAIVERANQSNTELTLWDNTANSVVARINWDWSSNSISDPQGDKQITTKLTDSGPNDGEVRLLACIGAGTNGNSRELFLDLDRNTSGSETSYCHYAHHVELDSPTSPFPYVGTPSARSGEGFFVSPGAYDPNAVQAWYIRFIAGTLIGDTGSGRWVVAHGDGANPRFLLRGGDSTPGRYNFLFLDTDGNSTTRVVDIGTSDPLQHIEAVYVVDPSDGNSRLVARADGGTEQDSGANSPANWTAPSDLGASNRVVYNESGALNGTGRGSHNYVTHHAVYGDALDNDPLTGPASSVMDELAGHTV